MGKQNMKDYLQILYENDIPRLKRYLSVHDINEEIHGETLLTRAAFINSEAISLKLIELGADVNKRDNSGRSPLHIACYFGFYQIAKHLLENGAVVDKVCFERALNGWDGNKQQEIMNLLEQWQNTSDG